MKKDSKGKVVCKDRKKFGNMPKYEDVLNEPGAYWIKWWTSTIKHGYLCNNGNITILANNSKQIIVIYYTSSRMFY